MAEASAIIRRTGNWSVQVGPAGLIGRFLKRDAANPELELRLGIIASFTAALTLSTLEAAGIVAHKVRVQVQAQAAAGIHGSQAKRTLITLAVECEASELDVRARCQSCLQAHPVFSLLNIDSSQVELRVQTYSGIHVRIP